MRDKYASFATLAQCERGDAYTITLRDLATAIVVAAPHGGGIEPGTSEVARSIAGDDFSLYLFEGTKSRLNSDLHITSVKFDEPKGLSLLRSARIVVTIHGESSRSEVVDIGGLHTVLIATLRATLHSAGFKVRQDSKVALRGLDQRNVCNIGTCGAGVQLELSKGLRRSFFASLSRSGRKAPTPRLLQFTDALRQVLRDSPL